MTWIDAGRWLLVGAWFGLLVALAGSLVRDALDRRRRRRARHHFPRFGARPGVDDLCRRLSLESTWATKRSAAQQPPVTAGARVEPSSNAAGRSTHHMPPTKWQRSRS